MRNDPGGKARPCTAGVFRQGEQVSRVRRRCVVVALILGSLAVVSGVVYFLHTRGILYKTVHLPSIDPSFRAHSLNDRGQIVLSSPTGLYVWDPKTGLRDIGVLAALYPNHPIPINNAGQVCGGLLDPNGCMQAFFWDPNTGLHMLGTFGEKNSWALALNNKGQVVGFAGPKAHDGSNPPPKAFLWSTGAAPVLLDMRALGFGGPACVNDQAQVAGFVYSYGQPKGFFAFRWEATGATSTHLIGDPMSGTVYIDRHGSVVWARRKGKDGPSRVVIWEKGDQERQIRFSDDAVHIHCVNDAGQILVSAFQIRSPARRSWFRVAVSRLLPSREPGAYWLCDPRGKTTHIRAHARSISLRFQAVALNNRGWILGQDYDPNGTGRWLILKPIREN